VGLSNFLNYLVLKWTVRWLLTTYYYYSRPGIVCVTFDDDCGNRNEKVRSSCWAFSVYLVDSGGASPAQLRQSIADGVRDRPALKLVRKAEAFGWIHLWRHPEGGAESALNRMSSVQELPPVWKHQLVTEETVHVRKFDKPQKIESNFLIYFLFFLKTIGIRVGSFPTTGRNRNGS
jgi:hypothetical protein